MTQEEKARAYDKAFESIKKFLAEFKRRMPKDVFEDAKTIFEDNFPELAESEDEKVKRILHSISSKMSANICDIFTEEEFQCFDAWSNIWLKKQGDTIKIIKKGKNYLCTKTHKYAGVEWIEGVKYYSPEDYSLVNQGCTYYCPFYSKEEHNNFFKEVEYDGCLEKQVEQKPFDYENATIIQKDFAPKEVTCTQEVETGNGNIKALVTQKSPAESLGISPEKYNEIVNECIYGEEKPADKVEPKFHEGDWVVCEITGSVYQIKNCIENLSNHKYGYDLTNGGYIGSDEVNHYHLWTINDAKDGDVLVASDNSVFAYAGSTDRHAKYYAALTKWGTFNIEGGNWDDKNSVHPATKEQRDAFEKAMAEAGYTFDFDKKELRKIEQEPVTSAGAFARIEEIEQKLANSAKTCKNDTLLDLLHKIPSYITVDGIFYHFMLSKTSLSYMAFYEGEGEGGGKIIFWMTGEPIELLTAMLEKLKKEGLLE